MVRVALTFNSKAWRECLCKYLQDNDLCDRLVIIDDAITIVSDNLKITPDAVRFVLYKKNKIFKYYMPIDVFRSIDIIP